LTTLEEIRRALERLNLDGQYEIHHWLGNRIDSRYRSSGVKEPQPAYADPNPPIMTFDEFLEFAERSPLRYEYVNGIVHAMTGPSVAHCRIAGELFAIVHHHLQGGPCQAFATGPNLQIRSKTDEIQYIPDLMVACNPDEWDADWVCNPKLVAEVLSPSTRKIDLREKSGNYRRVESIEEYLVLEQSKHEVTVFRRAEEWRGHVYRGVDAIAELRSIALSIPLTQIYEGALPSHGPR
jgi:Uma2 family endonuclease